MRAVDLRLQVRQAQDAVRDSLRHFGESRKSFMSAIRSLHTGELELDSISLRLESDEDALRQRITELHDLYNQMTDLDSELLKEDGNEAGLLETDYVRSLLENGQIAASSMQTVRDPAYDGDIGSEPEIPDLLRELFDAIGELRLMQERLVDELPYEHADQRLRRQMKMDQDEALSETDEEFEEKCRQEVVKVNDEIEALRLRVDRLHAQAVSAGLDPNPSRYQRQSPSGSVVDWLDSVVTPADIAIEELEEVLVGSTKTSRPGSTTSQLDSHEYHGLQIDECTESVSPNAQPEHLGGEVETTQCHGLDSSSTYHETTKELSVHPATHVTQRLLKPEQEENTDQQWVVLAQS